MSQAVVPEVPRIATTAGWLHGAKADLTLVAGVLALALLLGGAALARPALFGWVLLADLWLLAYPHVAATFTRVASDRRSLRAHWFLLFALPPLVFAATAGVTWIGGVIALNTTYFYWQTYHYTMQSYGVARAYRRRAGGGPDPLTASVIFAFPLWGVLHRAHQRPSLFYGSPIWSPPVPRAAAIAAGGLALSLLAAWTLRELRAARAAGLAPAGAADAPPQVGRVLFVLSHVVITVLSYVVVTEVTRGWLFINIWHNAQYLVFVWLHRSTEHEARQKGASLLRYAAACIGVSALFYLMLGELAAPLSAGLLPVVLICHQAVNFHHYLVDAVIWRSPRQRAPAPAV
jgi:hypothetical protein